MGVERPPEIRLQRRRLLAGVAVLLAGACLAFAASAARSEVDQRGGVRLSVNGRISPVGLPRRGAAPVAVAIDGRITPTVAGTLPQLRRITIAINSHGRLDYHGLPRCRQSEIQPSTSDEALAICRRALIGTGSFSSDVLLPEQSPFPSHGQVLAFNGRYHGHPAILAHIYGTDPAPASYVLPFTIRRTGGTFGTVLEASLPQLTGSWGFVTGLSLALGRGYASTPAGNSYITASCPAPAGFTLAAFPLARVGFEFAGGPKLTTTLTRSCRVS